MIKSSILFILLFCVLTNARVYRLTVDDSLRGDYFYTVATMLENIPELHIRVLDGTDTDIYRLGRSGCDDQNVALLVNGVKSLDFQDGVFIDALRPFANNGIDSIVVYTGLSAMQVPGEYDVVIAVHTKKMEDPSFRGMTYVGSEIGDPAIYLHLLEGEKPYNKEQLASGELWGAYRTGALRHDVGFIMTYMDRYSNGHEAARAIQYGELNSNNSLCEVRKGSYGLSIAPSEKQRWDLTFSGADYNLFRYDTFDERYRFYTGQRGGAQIGGRASGEVLSLTVGVNATYEETHHYESRFDSSAGDWGALSYALSMDFPQDFQLTVMGENEVGTKPTGGPGARAEINLKRDNSIALSKKVYDSLFTVMVGYPLMARLDLKKRVNNLLFYGGIGLHESHDSASGASVQLQSELLCEIETKGVSRITLGAGIENAPHEQKQYLTLMLSEQQKQVWASIEYGFDRFIQGYIHGSNYLIKGGLSSTFNVRGLTIGGGVQVYSKSFWNVDNRQVSFGDRRKEGVFALDARFRGSVKMSYGLFNEHLRVAIALRDIGKVKRDLPQGSLVGPVIVSNFLFSF